MNDRPSSPADHVKAHPLAEMVLTPLPLKDVRLVLEGVDPDGQVIRLRSAGLVEFHRPDHLSLVEVQPLERVDSRAQISKPAEHHIVLVGQLMPTEDDGSVYVIELLEERSL